MNKSLLQIYISYLCNQRMDFIFLVKHDSALFRIFHIFLYLQIFYRTLIYFLDIEKQNCLNL